LLSSLDDPVGVAVDRSNSVFVADYGSDKIFKYTTNGVLTTFASGLDQPTGLAFDNAGNLYEADSGSGKIFKFNSRGISTPFASGLNAPALLAFEPSAPSLNISQGTGSQMVLYWPAVGSIYDLQTATNLSSTNWVTVTNGMQITGVVVTNASPSAFFRLATPSSN
jgi:DNA-binding beta-propeller fold protein YncE